MSILVDHQIADLCLGNRMVVPYHQKHLNPASLDVTIGDSLLYETEEGGWRQVDLSVFDKQEPLWLNPKEFVLVATDETFNLPDTVGAEFRIKSSRAREGYNNILAVWCDPGWHGSKLTLEITNESRYRRLPIYPGLKIGQMVFHQMAATPESSYAVTGRYNNDAQVEGSRG